jgi:uncharacterized protein YdaU (DUF1376 family)
MAKDPAFLFYPNDFDSATKFFTDQQVGIYLRLLIAQFQHGRLSEKQVLFISKTYDQDVMKKFCKDENGNFYSERLEFEIVKRKNFSESRRNNRIKKTSASSDKDMSPHMENENENENRKKEIKIEMPFVSVDFISVWGKWKQYKLIQHKFKYKSKQTEQASLAQLVKLSDNNEAIAIKIINQSIANGWKGLFADKTNTNDTIKKSNDTSRPNTKLTQI